MMCLRRPAAAALGGLTLVVALAGAAAAATGEFHWTGPSGKPYYAKDLPDGRCFDMEQEARGARNASNTAVVVYAQKKCKGTATTLAPGKAAPARAPFASFRFSPK
ncbi:hypothetical protein [Streptomyces bambusae]|uniref:Uncharacterized protein n=1 Tax=Streptomyces bambusae TaxID=1550616 RepID=A0ABS6ZAI0_9ACTN|nr:hypothetical protein [Streptomyces bambusae]MBW5484774.1 hypothetical protein [Streptomyces bambusae]